MTIRKLTVQIVKKVQFCPNNDIKMSFCAFPSLFLRLSVLYFLLLFTSCHFAQEQTNRQRKKEDIQSVKNERKCNFLLPEIPVTLITDEGRNAYLSQHYWDNLCLDDTTCWADSATFQKTFVDYIFTVSTQEIQVADQCIEQFMKKLSTHENWTRKILHLAYYYLFDISSPIVNEAMYVPFVRTALQTPYFSSIEREEYEFQYRLSSINNPSHKASNFTFQGRDGRTTSLYQTVRRNTILVFSDPECDSCKETVRLLYQDEVISQLISQGELDLLMIYTEGSPRIWQYMKKAYPQSWLLGFDAHEDIRMKGIYSLRAMPSIYFLDSRCTVFLKDKSVHVVISFIRDHVRGAVGAPAVR